MGGGHVQDTVVVARQHKDFDAKHFTGWERDLYTKFCLQIGSVWLRQATSSSRRGSKQKQAVT